VAVDSLDLQAGRAWFALHFRISKY
jgi:hypothetical protein